MIELHKESKNLETIQYLLIPSSFLMISSFLKPKNIPIFEL